MLQNIVGFCALALALYAGWYLCAENKRRMDKTPSVMPASRYPTLERVVSLGFLGFIFSYVLIYFILAIAWDMRWAFRALTAPLRTLGLL